MATLLPTTPTDERALPSLHEVTSSTGLRTRLESGSTGFLKKASDAIGFNRTYNFPLWVIFGGAMIGFCLARFELLSDRIAAKELSPGEWFWFSQRVYKIGYKLHLGAMLPCGILAVFQFIPRIRYKAIFIHRINGYLVLLTLGLGIAGAVIIARRSFGGSLAFQIAGGVLVLLTLVSSILAYVNIKRLQIDQHRKWMLRMVFYLSPIVTTRLIVFATTAILNRIDNSYYTVWRCDELAFTMNDPVRFNSEYPSCGSGIGPHHVVPVQVNLSSVEHRGSAIRLTFPAALWLAIFIHAVGVEAYIHLTPRESERLREVSYQRQLEAGFRHPGSAGLTSDRLGDAEAWTSKAK